MDNRNIKKIYGGGGLKSHKIFDEIISLKNLFSSWNEFKEGKGKKIDVQKFGLNLENNIFNLYNRLKNNVYQHSDYTTFYIQDPKLRRINKAEVKDRVLHHAVVKIIEPIFEKTFIFDSYSSRIEKGTHKAVKRLKKFAWKLSRNNTKTVWILQCDIKKFFDSIDHNILIKIIESKINDNKALKLIENIICSFEVEKGRGIPLGNLTSQLFSNIYLNKLDQFIKRKIRAKYYIRYADDFVVLSRDKAYLESLTFIIEVFLKMNLNLQLHPKKIIIKRWNEGVDFLGYVSFPHYTVLRTKTKKRILKKIKNNHLKLKNNLVSKKFFKQSLQSYLGILTHCRGLTVVEKIKKIITN